jgi:hypothetical protein
VRIYHHSPFFLKCTNILFKPEEIVVKESEEREGELLTKLDTIHEQKNK